MTLRPLTDAQRAELRRQVITPPGAAIRVEAVTMPPDIRDGIASAFGPPRRTPAARAALWGLLGLAAVLAAWAWAWVG